jgi:hypothetical protein
MIQDGEATTASLAYGVKFVMFVGMVPMKFASLILRIFHWINLDGLVRLVRFNFLIVLIVSRKRILLIYCLPDLCPLRFAPCPSHPQPATRNPQHTTRTRSPRPDAFRADTLDIESFVV